MDGKGVVSPTERSLITADDPLDTAFAVNRTYLQVWLGKYTLLTSRTLVHVPAGYKCKIRVVGAYGNIVAGDITGCVAIEFSSR